MDLFRATVALALLVVTGACSGPPDGREASPPSGDTVDAPAADRPRLPDLLAAVHDRTPAGELSFLARLPAPEQIRREPVQNRHDPARTDTLETRVYPGLRLEIYRVAASGKAIVRSVEVTGEGYRTAEDLGPGRSAADVREVLGEPTSVEGETLVYHRADREGDPTPTTLSVELRGDRVHRMTWSFYVD